MGGPPSVGGKPPKSSICSIGFSKSLSILRVFPLFLVQHPYLLSFFFDNNLGPPTLGTKWIASIRGQLTNLHELGIQSGGGASQNNHAIASEKIVF